MKETDGIIAYDDVNVTATMVNNCLITRLNLFLIPFPHTEFAIPFISNVPYTKVYYNAGKFHYLSPSTRV